MPFVSKDQGRKFARMAATGEISMKTFRHWANETKDFKKLPEKKKKK